MEHSLADRGDGEELIDTKVVGVYSYKSWTDRCTLMEQSLKDSGEGKELIDTKLGVCIRRTAD